jgi:hypothetical protein
MQVLREEADLYVVWCRYKCCGKKETSEGCRQVLVCCRNTINAPGCKKKV